MSLGELSTKIGVSRKAVYEYERSQMGATLATVARIEEILDADIISGINIFDWQPGDEVPDKTPTGVVAKQLHNKLKKIGCKAIGFTYAPIDVHVRNTEVSFLTNEDNLNEAGLEKKVESAVDVGKILGIDPILVTCDKHFRDQNITTLKIDDIKKLESAKDLETLLNKGEIKRRNN